MNTAKMNLALYHPWVYLKGGAERVILNIVTRSRHNWTVFTNHFDRFNTFPELQNINIIELSKISVKRNYFSVATSAIKVLFQKVDLKKFDALLISSEGVGDFFTLRNHNIPIICFCHTPLKVIHDPFTKKRYLMEHKFSVLKYVVFSSIFKIVDKIAWSFYDYIVCNSEETRNRVLKAKLTSPEKIEVIHPGIDVKKITPIWEYRKYFLIPGRIMWQKNIELGIKAFQQFQIQYPNYKFELIIAGMVDEKSKSYYDKLLKLSYGWKNIKFVVNPSDEQLFELYKYCYSVIFTPLNEDWGIVPLEAMAFGKPVICINQGGPRESVINNKTGFLLNNSIEEFVKVMALLAHDESLVYKIGIEGRRHIYQFDWSIFINKLDDLIETIVKRKKGLI
jgi:glycosyltransferase involved in cell wall biosynthesis